MQSVRLVAGEFATPGDVHPTIIGLVAAPEDRREAARSYVESVGGTLHGFWYAFGAHDGITLWEAPDDVSMAAVVLAIGSGGAVTNLETIVLMSVEDTLEALRTAQGISYRPPAA